VSRFHPSYTGVNNQPYYRSNRTDLRDIPHSSILNILHHVFRQLHLRHQREFTPTKPSPAQPQARAPTTRPTHHAHDLDGIHARHIAIQALPPRDPALRRVRQRDEALVHLRRAFLDRVRGVGQPEEVFAVRAAFFEEALDFHQGRG